MSVVLPTKESWSQVTGPGILQAKRGRILVATNPTPSDSDWIVLASGNLIATSKNVWVKALDEGVAAVILNIAVASGGGEPVLETPGAPGLTIDSYDENSITLNFIDGDAGGSPITSRKIYGRVKGGASLTPLTTPPWEFTSLDDATWYEFWATATNAQGEGAASTVVEQQTATTGAPATAPAKPAAPTLASKTDTTITVSFVDPDDGGSAITTRTLYVGGTVYANGVTSPYQLTMLDAETPYSITWSATNSVGESQQSDALSVTTEAAEGEPGDDALADTTLADSITVNGVRFDFDEPALVGHFPNGDGFVVPQTTTQWTGGSHPSGDLAGNGHIGNGAMLNPVVPDSRSPTSDATTQAFDSYLTLRVSAAAVGFDNQGNIDPAQAGPQLLTAGTSIVKAIRMPGIEDDPGFDPTNEKTTGFNAPWRAFEKYATLHVLDAVPYRDSYAPSASALDKTMWRRRDVSRSACRLLTFPPDHPTYAQVLSKIPDNLGRYGATDEHVRRWVLEANNYSAQRSKNSCDYIRLLHSDALTEAQWWEIADRVIAFGVQLHGLTTRGAWPNGAAGQSGDATPWMMAAGFLLGSQEMLSAAQTAAVNNNTSGTAFWVREDNLGAVYPYDRSKPAMSQPLMDGMLGMPLCTLSGEAPGQLRPSTVRYSSNYEMAYTPTATALAVNENLTVALFEGGTDALLDGGAYGPENQRAAALALMTQVRSQRQPDLIKGREHYLENHWYATYDMLLTAEPDLEYQTQPKQVIGIGSTDDWIFTSVAGGVEWDLSSYNWNPGPAITQVDLRYCMNQGTEEDPVFVQWVQTDGVGETGSIDTLQPEVSHLFGVRRHNALGASAWSQNVPSYHADLGSVWRGRRTPLGTASAIVPTFVVDPEIHMLRYPDWEYDEWVLAPAQLEMFNIRLACGIGYVTGDTDRTVSFEWRADGTPIPGETGYDIELNSSIQGAVTCLVTVETPSGTVAKETSAVQAFAGTSLDISQYYGTDDGDVLIDWDPASASLDVDDETVLAVPNLGGLGAEADLTALSAFVALRSDGFFEVTEDTYNVLGCGQLNIDGAHIFVVARQEGRNYANFIAQGTSSVLYYSAGKFNSGASSPSIPGNVTDGNFLIEARRSGEGHSGYTLWLNGTEIAVNDDPGAITQLDRVGNRSHGGDRYAKFFAQIVIVKTDDANHDAQNLEASVLAVRQGLMTKYGIDSYEPG